MNPFKQRFFGVRLFEVAAFACVLALAFGVYLAKTAAGRERAQIANTDRLIAEEQRKLKLLRAEVAHLEQPERLGRLSQAHLGLQAGDGTREALPETLPDIVNPAEGKPQPAPSAVPPQPTPATPTPTPPAAGSTPTESIAQ